MWRSPPFPEESGNPDDRKGKRWIYIIIGVVGGILLIGSLVGVILFVKRRSKIKYERLTSVQVYSRNEEKGGTHIYKGKLLGKGGMGTVYSCKMDGERGNLALKVVNVPREGKEREMALQEVEVLKSLDHPNIVPLVAVQIRPIQLASEEVWAVMELFDGSLKEVIERKKGKWFNEKELLRWLTEILKGLKYLHEKGIAHRDIKVRNSLSVNK